MSFDGQTAIFSALPVAVAQCSAAMRYVKVSQRYAEWLGVAREEILGHSILEVMGTECLQGMRPHVEAALAGKPMERDAEVVHKKLGRRWIHVDCVPTFDRTGAPDGWIEAIADVTEQRRIEQSLQENRRTLQSFYDSSPFFMGLVELDGDSIVFLSANQALARALGTTRNRWSTAVRRSSALRKNFVCGCRATGGADTRARRCGSSTRIPPCPGIVGIRQPWHSSGTTGGRDSASWPRRSRNRRRQPRRCERPTDPRTNSSPCSVTSSATRSRPS